MDEKTQLEEKKLPYVAPRLVELGDAAVLTEGCTTGVFESDCALQPSPPIPANGL